MKFVLVRTAYASNIGATARALTTMGFSDLRLVQPQADPKSERALALAAHSENILNNVKIYENLESAIKDTGIVVAASHRHRRIERPVVNAVDLKKWLVKYNGAQEAAVVFGPESTGLTLDELSHCDVIVRIPTASSQPSLNLAQAAMVIAWELTDVDVLEKPNHIKRQENKIVREGDFRVFKKRLGTVLSKLNLEPERYLSRVGEMKAGDKNLVYDVLNKQKNFK